MRLKVEKKVSDCMARSCTGRRQHVGISKVAAIGLSLFAFLCLIDECNAERFFQKHSTWYEPMPASPKLDPDSAAKVRDILCVKGATPNYPSSGPECSGSQWFYPSQNQPIARSTATTLWTRFMTWECAKDAKHPSCTTDYRTFQKLGWADAPVPEGTLPADNQKHLNCFPGACGDGWLAVTNGKYEWDCGGGIYFPTDWPEVRLRGKYACRYLRRWDLSGDGVLWPADNNGSPRFAWTPFLHGVITYNEVVNEPDINHALSFAYSGAQCEPHWCMYPCPAYTGGTVVTQAGSKCDQKNPEYPLRNSAKTSSKPLLGGERLFLPSSVNCDALGISNMLELKICKALKKYGMIMTENSGRGYNVIHVEDTTGKPYSWGSLYQGFMKKIPWNQLQVSVPLRPPFGGDEQARALKSLAVTSVSPTQINLSWDLSSDSAVVKGYAIERCRGAGCTDFVEIGTTGATEFTDIGLSPGTKYSYRVRARNASGNNLKATDAVSASTFSEE